MSKFSNPHEALKHHVSGAIERGEKVPVTELKYADADCFALAKECSNLMGKVMNSSKRNTLTLAQKLAIQKAARDLDAARRTLLGIEERPQSYQPGSASFEGGAAWEEHNRLEERKP